MRLAGQGLRAQAPAPGWVATGGYAMAALLVGMSVMAVIMGALLPVWTQMVTREKEEELVFRGTQYVRAIALFQRKFANTNPPTIDLLVEQRFLRKKFKDPITNDDFQPLYAAQATQGVSAPTGANRPGEEPTEALEVPNTPQPGAGAGSRGATAAGGIIGVTSKSKARSLKLYNGRDRYNEWTFVYVQTAQRPSRSGAPGQGTRPGQAGPGQPGQPPRPFGMPPGAFGASGQRPGPQPNRPPTGPAGGTPVTPPQQRPPGD